MPVSRYDIENMAKVTALALNGGNWDKDYNEEQKEFWREIARYIEEKERNL